MKVLMSLAAERRDCCDFALRLRRCSDELIRSVRRMRVIENRLGTNEWLAGGFMRAETE